MFWLERYYFRFVVFIKPVGLRSERHLSDGKNNTVNATFPVGRISNDCDRRNFTVGLNQTDGYAVRIINTVRLMFPDGQLVYIKADIPYARIKSADSCCDGL